MVTELPFKDGTHDDWMAIMLCRSLGATVVMMSLIDDTDTRI